MAKKYQNILKGKQKDIMRRLALRFIKENGYTKKQFKDVDIGTTIENEVCNWIDSISGTLVDYKNKEWDYKNYVYEEVCDILGIG